MSAADRKKVREAIQKYTKAAAWEAKCIRENDPPDYGYVRAHLRGYIFSKYMMPEDECRSDAVADLTEASLARMMRVTPELAAQLDTARSCAGATSATVKKALLFQAMERDFCIVLPAAEAVAAKDVSALARLVLRCTVRQRPDVPGIIPVPTD
ncbi:MAG: hypothetical protein IKN89_04240 [Oscillospiraceae bacterium]|nr:hypothetical protein [Oscillospiraceae bacterium]